MRAKIDETYSNVFTADDDRMLILGDALLWELENFPDSGLSRAVLDYLNEHLTDSDERALFNLAPVLPPDDTVIALPRR